MKDLLSPRKIPFSVLLGRKENFRIIFDKIEKCTKTYRPTDRKRERDTERDTHRERDRQTQTDKQTVRWCLNVF